CAPTPSAPRSFPCTPLRRSKSIEGGFRPQVERPLDQALGIARTYYQNLQAAALRHAERVARVIARDGLLAESRREGLAAYLVERSEERRVGKEWRARGAG